MNPVRLDQFLKRKFEQYSREDIQKFISQGLVKVNEKKITQKSFLVAEEDNVVLDVNIFTNNENYIKPIEHKLDIVFEDDYLVVINKPKGLLSHPAKSSEASSVLNALVFNNQIEDENFDDNDERPGVVHRLDKNTTGLMVYAKTKKVLVALQDLFLKREVVKKYYAIVENPFDNKLVTITLPISKDPKYFFKQSVQENGKEAKTVVHVLTQNKTYALLECDLYTGRMHQIRIHLSAIGHPLVGDIVYKENKNENPELFLHSCYLSFVHPITNKKLQFFVSPDKDFKSCLKNLGLVYDFKKDKI